MENRGYPDSGVKMNTNEWYRIVVTGNSTDWNLYINGSKKYSVSDRVKFKGHCLSIGRAYPTSSYSNGAIDGNIRNCAIYNRVLSDEEISSLDF